MIVNVHRARTEHSGLPARAEAGDEVVIARPGQPITPLVPGEPRGRRQPGTLPGKNTLPDGFFFFDPLPEEEPKAREGRQVVGALASQGFRGLPITVEDGRRAGGRPGPHRDPLDRMRMLAAQSRSRYLPIRSKDETLDDCGVRRVC